MREQAAWALGNMAADASQLRDMIVEAGALRPLVDLTKPQAKVRDTREKVKGQERGRQEEGEERI